MKGGREVFFGVESELAVYAEGGGCTEGEAAGTLVSAALALLPNVSDGAGGGFIGNGARIYPDAAGGSECHLELATAELGSLEELIAQWESGCSLLAAIGGTQGSGASGSALRVSTRTYDLVNRVAFASHENYSLVPPSRSGSMIPFLVSRVVFCGGGGLDPYHPGIRFLVSTRASFTPRVESRATQTGRGIWDLLNITQARPSGNSERFHVHCADGSRSPLSLYLRLGATALVAAAIEAGLRVPLAEVELKNPLAAYKIFSADRTCRASVDLDKGHMPFRRKVTAIELQRRYLAMVESVIARLPEWAPTVCQRWRAVLEELEDDPAKLGDRLDWAIKDRLIITRQIERSAFGSWEAVERINPVMIALERLLQERAGSEARLGSQTLSDLDSDQVRETWRIMDVPSKGGDEVELARSFLLLKESLVELDYRYNEFGDDCLFNRLEKAGAIKPRLPGMPAAPEGDPFNLEAPSQGRARRRALLVKRYGKRGLGGTSGLRAWWHYLYGPDGLRYDFPCVEVDPGEQPQVLGSKPSRS